MQLREKKAARIRLNIVKATTEFLRQGSLKNLNVNEICDRAEISKVTFFKYFPHKEDVLVYFFRLWELEREVEQLSSPKRGLEAIYNLFEKASEKDEGSLGVMLGVTAFLANLTAPPPYFPLEVAERKLLYPEREEAWDLKVPTCPEMFTRHINEAIADGELSESVDAFELTKILLGIFHGLPVVAHMFQEKNLSGLYREHLDILFSSSKTLLNRES